jgi:hypothetical protein
MILDGFSFGASFFAVSPVAAGESWAKDILEKNKLHRLKAATNKDLELLNAILSSKFAAKIGGEGQNMKKRLKKALIRGRLKPRSGAC